MINTSWQPQVACDSSDTLTELFQGNPFFSQPYPAASGRHQRLHQFPHVPLFHGFHHLHSCELQGPQALLICVTTHTSDLLWALYHGLQINMATLGFGPFSQQASVLFLSFWVSSAVGYSRDQIPASPFWLVTLCFYFRAWLPGQCTVILMVHRSLAG